MCELCQKNALRRERRQDRYDFLRKYNWTMTDPRFKHRLSDAFLDFYDLIDGADIHLLRSSAKIMYSPDSIYTLVNGSQFPAIKQSHRLLARKYGLAIIAAGRIGKDARCR